LDVARRLARLAFRVAGLAVVMVLGACASAAVPHNPIWPAFPHPRSIPRPITGPAWTFTVGGERMAFAVLPPASMVLVRTGPYTFWATPSYQPRYLYLQEVVAGRPAGAETLDINLDGTVDYRYTLDWS
jgi:hypothetical protein